MSSSLPSRSLAKKVLCALALAASAALAAPGCGGSGSDDDPVPPSRIRLTFNGQVPSNAAMSSVTVFSRLGGVALMNNISSSGPRPETLFAFDPLSGSVATATAQATITTATALLDDGGASITSWTTSFPAFAAAAGGKLYVTTSNQDPTSGFVAQPGSVLVYDYDLASGALGGMRAPIVAVHGGATYYNATWIGAYTTPAGAERLALICSGTFGFGSVPAVAAVLVIDPATDTVAEAVTFAARSVGAGEAAISSDRRLYVGGQGFTGAGDAQVYVIDLSTSPPTVRHSDANPILLPSSSVSQLIGDLRLSADQQSLYATNFNDRAVHVLTLVGAGSPDTPSHVTRVAAMGRGTTVGSQNAVQSVAVRPGFRGVNYTSGPDLAVGTIKITSATAQVVTDVQTAVDAVDTSGAAPAVTLDAFVAPFPVHEDIQGFSTLAIGSRKQYLFAVMSQSAEVFVVDFDSLK